MRHSISPPRPSRTWQIQWPISWAMVKRRRSGLEPASRWSIQISRQAGMSIPETPRGAWPIARPKRSSAIDSTSARRPAVPKTAA